MIVKSMLSLDHLYGLKFPIFVNNIATNLLIIIYKILLFFLGRILKKQIQRYKKHSRLDILSNGSKIVPMSYQNHIKDKVRKYKEQHHNFDY